MPTTKIDRFTRDNCQEIIKPRLAKALKALEKIGVKAAVGAGRFTDTAVTLQVHLFLESVDPARGDFEKVCWRFGLTPGHYGAEFQFNGNDYKLVGLNPAWPEYPVIAERKDTGRRFKLPRVALEALPQGGAEKEARS